MTRMSDPHCATYERDGDTYRLNLAGEDIGTFRLTNEHVPRHEEYESTGAVFCDLARDDGETLLVVFIDDEWVELVAGTVYMKWLETHSLF